MKNIILTTIIILFVSILSSCSKKDNIRSNSVAFYNNPFSSKSILATAD